MNFTVVDVKRPKLSASRLMDRGIEALLLAGKQSLRRFDGATVELTRRGRLFVLQCQVVVPRLLAPVDGEPAGETEAPELPLVDEEMERELMGREEVEPPIAMEVPLPGEPTSEERRHHRLTHLPYQPWCNVCVRARASENRHESRSQNQPGTPVIQRDCCFLKTEEDAPMFTVLVAIDTVHKQMVASPLEKKGNRGPFAIRSLAAFARYVGHPKVIIQGDSEPSLMTVIHDACVFLTAATPRTSPVNSKGSNGAAERAVQSVEGMARTLRLDLLGRTNVAVGSDLPITSWMVRHAAWLLSPFQAGVADGKTACARQFEKPHESPVLPFAERVMWKDPTLQPANLKSSWSSGVWLGRSQTSNARLIGTRLGIVVARTIRRLPASEREEASLVVAMWGTPVAGRPAEAAADDAPTVTRHAEERKEVIVVPASSGAPLHGGQRQRRQCILHIQFQTCPSRWSRSHRQQSPAAGEPSHCPRGEKAESLGPGDNVPMELAPAVEPRAKSHAPVEEHDERLAPKRPRGRPATRVWPRPGSAPNTQLVVQSATAAATDSC